MILLHASLKAAHGASLPAARYGSMVKRLRHRPFTAVTGVQIPLESLEKPFREILGWRRYLWDVRRKTVRFIRYLVDSRGFFVYNNQGLKNGAVAKW